MRIELLKRVADIGPRGRSFVVSDERGAELVASGLAIDLDAPPELRELPGVVETAAVADGEKLAGSSVGKETAAKAKPKQKE